MYTKELAELVQEPKPRKGSAPKCRNWMLTLNNPADHLQEVDVDAWVQKVLRANGAECGAAQLEKGEENGTVHIQAYVRYRNARTFQSIRKHFQHCHILAANAARASWDYCTKEKTRIEV